MRRVLRSIWNALVIILWVVGAWAVVFLALTLLAGAVSLGWHHFAPQPGDGWVSYYPGAYYCSGGR